MLIDIIALILVLWFAMYFSKKGLVYSVLNAGSFIISAIVTFIFYEAFTAFLLNGPVGKFLIDKLTLTVAEEMVNAGGQYISGIPHFLQDMIFKTENVITSGAAAVAQMIAEFVLSIASIIVLFLLSKVLVSVVIKLLNLCAKMPILKQANKFLGFVIGAFIGVVWLYVILAILGLLSFTSPIAWVIEQVEKSRYVIDMYNSNIILNLFL